MKIEGIIFDLDGTLVNSIEDIADSMNAVLTASDYPTHSYDTYETFIGSGIRNLVSKAMPADVKTEAEIDRLFAAMFDYYKDHCTKKTSVYPGILELLHTLEKKQLNLAILSNKADALTKKVAIEKLPTIFKPVVGLTTEELKKPNPEVVLNMCKSLELDTNKAMFVGDSTIDIQTAKNSGLVSVGVTWGFQTEEALQKENPDYIIHTPEELLKLL